MRAIKFRAWDKKNKAIESCTPLWWMKYWNQELKEGWEIMQYTGLKDKNGKEIYEGDIVSEGPESFDRQYHVKFNDYRFPLAIGRYHERDFKDAFLMEVIGNIYENGDLLT